MPYRASVAAYGYLSAGMILEKDAMRLTSAVRYTRMRKHIDGWSVVGAPVTAAVQLHEAQERAHRLGVEFLQTELRLAEAFLDLAETSRNAAARRRNRQNTAKALDAVGRFIESLNPEPRQRQLLIQRTAELRARLLDSGLRLESRSNREDPRCEPPL
jgi:hypothetical protein